MQVRLLVFDALPELLHEHVVPPAALSIHAELDAVVLQQARELAALVHGVPHSPVEPFCFQRGRVVR